MELTKLIDDFEAIVGWPYVSPGTNDERGIDCSGAFVRAFKRQGQSLYHGSNRMARSTCVDVKPLGESALRAGTVVFKARDSKPPAAYCLGGAWYDPTLTQDFYHVGLVVSVSPLRIIHATPPKARADSSAKGWTHTGFLKGLEGEGRSMQQIVAADSVNLREKASKQSALLGVIPKGTALETASVGDGSWVSTAYQGKSGFVMAQFLSGSDARVNLALSRETAEALAAALKEAGL